MMGSHEHCIETSSSIKCAIFFLIAEEFSAFEESPCSMQAVICSISGENVLKNFVLLSENNVCVLTCFLCSVFKMDKIHCPFSLQTY